jgi:hypothetical protein
LGASFKITNQRNVVQIKNIALAIIIYVIPLKGVVFTLSSMTKNHPIIIPVVKKNDSLEINTFRAEIIYGPKKRIGRCIVSAFHHWREPTGSMDTKWGISQDGNEKRMTGKTNIGKILNTFTRKEQTIANPIQIEI